jgi:hypothetical protein
MPETDQITTTASGLSSVRHYGQCKEHRTYSARRAPTGACLTCWRIYIALGVGVRERKLRTMALMGKLQEIGLKEVVNSCQ